MDKLYAIGDIHGCYKTLHKLFSKIAPSLTDKIVFLGDYIDRGPAIKQTLDFLIGLKQKGYQTEYLLGNHEWFLLNTVQKPSQSRAWYLNGGMTTLESFGIDSASNINPSYLIFFRNLQPYIQLDELLFVHAGFNDSIDDPFSDLETMLWTRNEMYMSKTLRDKTIIHGHTPTLREELERKVKNNSNVLNIDTGCVYNSRPGYGYLTAIELRSMTIHSVQNCD